MKNLFEKIYLINKDIKWSVENTGVYLINVKKGEGLFLEYPEAALWDFLSSSVPGDNIISMVEAISGMNREMTEVWIEDTLLKWEREGLVVKG